MCHILVPTQAERIVLVFKELEWFFLLWAVAVTVSLLFSKSVFEKKIKALNWLIKEHSLGGSVSGTEKGFKQFRRDLWILLILLWLLAYVIKII